MVSFLKVPRNLTIRDFYRIPLDSFSLIGLQLFAWDADDCWTLKAKIKLLILFLDLSFSFIAKLAFVLFRQFEGPLHITAYTIYVSFAVNGIFKMFSVWWGRNHLRQVIVDLDNVFPTTEIQRRKTFITIMPFLLFLYRSHWVVALMFTLFPFLQSVVELLMGQVFEYRYPYITVYWFDESRPLAYAFIYLTQLMAGSMVSLFFVNSDLLLLASVHLLKNQFDYLAERIQNFEPKDLKTNLCELQSVLDTHSRLLNHVERVDNVFSMSIMLNYLISILMICLIGFSVVADSGSFNLIKFAGFLFCALQHMFFVCYFSTKLQTSSTQIADAVAGQAWYGAELRYQRMLPLIAARAQRPAALTAFKFFVISMESFTSVVTTSYEFFTLVRTRYYEAKPNN